MTETATLSKAVGRTVLSGVTNALHLVRQPALALDQFGVVLDVNALAEGLFDDDFRIKDRRLCVHDRQARSKLDTLVDQMRTISDTEVLLAEPIVVPRRTKRPLVIRVLPVDGAARSPFLGARALLVLTDLSATITPTADVLGQTFGLTRAEAKLASLIATGISPEQVAEQLNIARETARNQLKSVFAKTDTHRQAELVALLARL